MRTPDRYGWTARSLRELRGRFDESREQWAWRVGVTTRTILNWEKGVTLPTGRAALRRLSELAAAGPAAE